MPYYFTILEPLLLVCLVVAWVRPLMGGSFFRPIENVGARLAAKKSVAILGIALAVILARINFGVIDPVPVPQVHDEFAHLLAGDTFAHGRLTNPTPPLPIFFETFHENMRPTYMSKYPPGQGAALAVGELLGSPWIGVLLSVAAMCAAVLWMLQGWLPARWALLGATLVWLRFGLFNYWVDSYWGGAVAATGGALVVGALPRIMRRRRPGDAMVMGLGTLVLANSRPYEGFLLCASVAPILLWAWTKDSAPWRTILLRFVVPFGIVLALGGTFVAYDNWRVTGSALLFPERLSDETYMTTPLFIWEKARAPLHYANPQFEAFYNDANLNFWREWFDNGPSQLLVRTVHEVGSFAYTYFWPSLWVPLLAAPCFLRDKKVSRTAAQIAFCLAGSLMVIWFWPHYVAPLTALIFLLAVQAMRHVRRWTYRGRPVGVGLTRVVVLLAVAAVPYHAIEAVRKPSTVSLFNSPVQQRAEIARELAAMPGEQLVIVRYATKHSPHEEWVYNEADIEHAKVVWAREIPGVDIMPLLEHFRARKVWLVEPDQEPPRVMPYSEGGQP